MKKARPIPEHVRGLIRCPPEKPVTAQITIDSTPAGARVYVDDNWRTQYGQTPCKMDIPESGRLVRVSKDKHYSSTQRVLPDSGPVLRVELERRPRVRKSED